MLFLIGAQHHYMEDTIVKDFQMQREWTDGMDDIGCYEYILLFICFN